MCRKDFPWQIVETLRIVDRYVEPEGITIVIEPLNRKESNIILNLTDGARLLQAVDRDSIRLLVDYYHFAMEEEALETLRSVMPYIRHVHFAEPQGRSFPKEAKAEYQEFFDVLREGGYADGVSVEAYSGEPEKEIAGAGVICREERMIK